MLGYDLIPSTLPRFSFTGNTVPPNDVLIRFHRIVRPTLPSRSVAPTTATLCGAKIAARAGRRPGTVTEPSVADVVVVVMFDVILSSEFHANAVHDVSPIHRPLADTAVETVPGCIVAVNAPLA